MLLVFVKHPISLGYILCIVLPNILFLL